MAGKMMRCKESFACDIDGVPIVVPAGTIVYASDPRHKGREQLFEEMEDAVARFAPRTERATAEPDEKRTLAGHRVHDPRESTARDPKEPVRIDRPDDEPKQADRPKDPEPKRELPPAKGKTGGTDKE